jgi:hypothetical protein
MKHIKLFEDFNLNELKGVRKKLTLSSDDDELYFNVLKKSKNENFKKVVKYMKDGLTVSAAIQNMLGHPWDQERIKNKVDYIEFMDGLTKDEKVYIYHLKNILQDIDSPTQSVAGSGMRKRKEPTKIKGGLPDLVKLYNPISFNPHNEWYKFIEEPIMFITIGREFLIKNSLSPDLMDKRWNAVFDYAKKIKAKTVALKVAPPFIKSKDFIETDAQKTFNVKDAFKSEKLIIDPELEKLFPIIWQYGFKSVDGSQDETYKKVAAQYRKKFKTDQALIIAALAG